VFGDDHLSLPDLYILMQINFKLYTFLNSFFMDGTCKKILALDCINGKENTLSLYCDAFLKILFP